MKGRNLTVCHLECRRHDLRGHGMNRPWDQGAIEAAMPIAIDAGAVPPEDHGHKSAFWLCALA